MPLSSIEMMAHTHLQTVMHALIDGDAGRKIFQGRADGFEQRDVTAVLPPRLLAARQFDQIGDDVIGLDEAVLERLGLGPGLGRRPGELALELAGELVALDEESPCVSSLRRKAARGG